MIKSCVVYKTNKEYKIVTESETDTGLFISDEPVFILPSTISDDELITKIFLSLNSSKEEIIFPVNREAMDKWQTKQLNNLNEKSFVDLYKNSRSCLIRIEDKILTIYPYEYGGARKGLIVNEEKIEKFNSSNDQNQILNYIKEM